MKNGGDLRGVIDQRKRNAQVTDATKTGRKAKMAKGKKRKDDGGAGAAAAAGLDTAKAQQGAGLPADNHVPGAQPAPQQRCLLLGSAPSTQPWLLPAAVGTTPEPIARQPPLVLDPHPPRAQFHQHNHHRHQLSFRLRLWLPLQQPHPQALWLLRLGRKGSRCRWPTTRASWPGRWPSPQRHPSPWTGGPSRVSSPSAGWQVMDCLLRSRSRCQKTSM